MRASLFSFTTGTSEVCDAEICPNRYSSETARCSTHSRTDHFPGAGRTTAASSVMPAKVSRRTFRPLSRSSRILSFSCRSTPFLMIVGWRYTYQRGRMTWVHLTYFVLNAGKLVSGAIDLRGQLLDGLLHAGESRLTCGHRGTRSGNVARL